MVLAGDVLCTAFVGMLKIGGEASAWAQNILSKATKQSPKGADF